MFKRKRRDGADDSSAVEPTQSAQESVPQTVQPVAQVDDDGIERTPQGIAAAQALAQAQAAGAAAEGPYDVSNVPAHFVNRVDLGAIQLAGFADLQLHFEPDPSGQRVASVVAAYNDAALRIQPLAAPRTGGLWADMRPDIMRSIKDVGGDVEEVEGVFGAELLAVVPAVTPEGEQVRQPVRLVGIAGPRWLLHGVFMGSAAMDDTMAELFEDVLRQTVVVRGVQPMAPGEVIELRLPPGADAGLPDGAQAADDLPLGPPEPGVHVTETR